jgi:hypothetical protein
VDNSRRETAPPWATPHLFRNATSVRNGSRNARANGAEAYSLFGLRRFLGSTAQNRSQDEWPRARARK